MQKKLYGFAALALFMMVCLFSAPVLAQTPVDFTSAIKQEMQNGSMDKWPGAMPLAAPADVDAYVRQFSQWAVNIQYGNGLGLSGDDLAVLNAYKAKAADIQAEAFPKIRANYYQMFKPFFDNYGLTVEYLQIEFLGEGKVNMEITSEAFADPDFLQEFYQGLEPSWPYCRFQKVELYARVTTETDSGSSSQIVLIKTATYNPEITDRSLLLYKNRKEYNVVE